MDTIQTKSLPVPGAKLSYSMRGSGPLLLLIPGGEGGGDSYDNMAEALSARRTVVTYDRRGAPGSPLDNPNEDVRLETHSEDAHLLLAALGSEPVQVFGSSGGALVGLDLLLRHPEQVSGLVAHEPPAEGILPDFDRFQAEVAEALQQGGIQAAMGKFINGLNIRYDDLEEGVVMPPRNPQEGMQRAQALMRYTFPAVHRYRLDVSALADSKNPLVLAGSTTGRDTPVYRCTQALADRLGVLLVEFPSHHAGYVSHPRAFAARLEAVLAGMGKEPKVS